MSMSAPKIPKPPKPPPPPASFADPQVQGTGAFLRFQLAPKGLLGATKGQGRLIQRGQATGPAIRPAVVRGSNG